MELGLHPVVALESQWHLGLDARVTEPGTRGQLVTFGCHSREGASGRQSIGEEQSDSAIWRTKGGLNVKVTALVDSRGRTLQILIDARDRADVKAAEEIQTHSERRLVANKEFNSNKFREPIWMWVHARSSHHSQHASNRCDGTVDIIAIVTKWRTVSRDSHVTDVLPHVTTGWP